MRQNKKVLLILMLSVITIAEVVANGSADIPDNSTEIQVEEIWSTHRDFYGLNIYLPYEKPEGVTEIYDSLYSSISVAIDSLIVDERFISPRIGFYFPDADVSIIAPIDSQATELFLKLLWEFDRQNQKFIYVYSRPHSEGRTNEFRISVGSKEIYMTYRIVFPNRAEVGPYTVHWTMEWPDDFGWD